MRILLLALMLSSLSITAKEKEIKFVYHTVIVKGQYVSEIEAESLDQVYLFINNFHPYFCADLTIIFKDSPFFQSLTRNDEIYVEIKKATSSWRLKRVSRKELQIYNKQQNENSNSIDDAYVRRTDDN